MSPGPPLLGYDEGQSPLTLCYKSDANTEHQRGLLCVATGSPTDQEGKTRDPLLLSARPVLIQRSGLVRTRKFPWAAMRGVRRVTGCLQRESTVFAG